MNSLAIIASTVHVIFCILFLLLRCMKTLCPDSSVVRMRDRSNAYRGEPHGSRALETHSKEFSNRWSPNRCVQTRAVIDDHNSEINRWLVERDGHT